MNESVRKVLLTISLIIVIVIFVDLIFNFSGLRMTKNNITEQFQSVAGNHIIVVAKDQILIIC